MALYRVAKAGAGSSMPIEANHGIFNTSYVDVSDMSPVGNGVGFFNVEDYNTANINLTGAGAYTDIQVYGYDDSNHTSTLITSQASIDISSYNYVLVKSNPGTTISFNT